MIENKIFLKKIGFVDWLAGLRQINVCQEISRVQSTFPPSITHHHSPPPTHHNSPLPTYIIIHLFNHTSSFTSSITHHSPLPTHIIILLLQHILIPSPPQGYVWVNRDTLKTAAKCLKVAREALADGKSVVIDNTNPSGVARQEYFHF